jgi:hypothetical protein
VDEAKRLAPALDESTTPARMPSRKRG